MVNKFISYSHRRKQIKFKEDALKAARLPLECLTWCV